MIFYTAKEDDVLDLLVWNQFGTTDVVPQVMAANPTVVDERLKAGTTIKLPYFDTVQKSTNEVRLWN